MFPFFAEQDISNGRSRYPQDFGHLLMSHADPASYPSHILFCKLGVGDFFPASISVPVLHLPIIFGKGSETQVPRVDTYWSVAGMQNKKPLRVAVVDAIRGNMSKHRDGPARATHTKLPVSLSVGAGCPIPTSRTGGISRHKPSKGLGLRETLRSQIPAPSQRVSVPEPSFVVGTTPSPSIYFPITTQNRTDGRHGYDYIEVI